MGAIYLDQIAPLTNATERLGNELETALRTDLNCSACARYRGPGRNCLGDEREIVVGLIILGTPWREKVRQDIDDVE